MSVSRGVAGPVELAGLFRDGAATGLTDAELLARFVECRDVSGEIAFRVIVARHGPMVLRNCRRVLRDRADADDAFQATFLVLVRRAGQIRVGTSLGPWLYGVSIRVARRIEGARACQSSMSSDVAVDGLACGRVAHDLELKNAIADAVGGLPRKYSDAISLCYLQGVTHDEAAVRLGCPVGTVRSRLARGRALLKERLRGLGVENVGWRWSARGVLECETASSVVEPRLAELTARAAVRVAVGASMSGVVSGGVASIVHGVIQAMIISRIAAVSAMFLSTAVAGWGVLSFAAPALRLAEPRVAAAAAVAVNAGAIGANGGDLSVNAEPPATAPVAGAGGHLEALAKLPAVVVKVEPAVGAKDVDPALSEIRVIFSREMMDGTWSWTFGNVYATPETDGKIHYEKDRRTCVMPVKLEAGKTYVVGINSERHHNFKDLEGRPALAYLVVFRTKDAQ